VAVERRSYDGRIVTDSTIMVGKPVVMGTRIPVETILRVLAGNPDLHELFAEYPRLSLDDVRACFAYASALVAGEDVTPTPRSRLRANQASPTG